MDTRWQKLFAPPPIKLAIVGSRHFEDYEKFSTVVTKYIRAHGVPSLIVSGGCRGTDKMAERYAKDHSIPTRIFLPDGYTSQSFLDRNNLIVLECTHMIAFPTASSKSGTRHAMGRAKTAKKPIHEHIV